MFNAIKVSIVNFRTKKKITDMDSNSVRLRKAGNITLQSISDEMTFFLKESRLLKSLQLYNESSREASSPYEYSSSLKNISVVSFRLFELYAAEGRNKVASFYAQETQIKSLEAYKIGHQLNVQNSQWLSELKDKQIEYVNSYLMNFLRGCKFSGDLEERVGMMVKLKEVSADHVKCWLNFNIAEAYYHNSVSYRDYDLLTSFRSINEGCFKITWSLFKLMRF